MERRARLLLVEDETSLRQLVAQFLRHQGYEVLEAEDGAQAVLQIDDTIDAPLDLVLLDLNLPLVHGVEVARHIRRVQPGLPVIVCSAAVIDQDEHSLRDIGVRRFLGKPYHPEHLLEAIAEQRIQGTNGDLVTRVTGPLP